MTDKTDAGLLRQFVRDHSEAAFRYLTERHLDLVFGTAVRRTSDHGAAEEITQNVFIALTRKAAWLQNETSLAGWLHQTTVLEARQWWRGETRRRQREQTASELETTMKTSGENDPAMSGVLDEALLELREGERQAVLLRFFEGRNHREIGAALGIGEDAARKRVDKAMDQLMAFFRKRGFAVGSAAMLATLLTAATGAPAGLTATILRAASAGGMTTTPWLAKILGVGRGQLAGLCLMTLLVPTVWQEARLFSARGEQRRLEALLALVQSQHAGMTNDLAKLHQQISRALAEADALKANSAALGSDGLEARLFLWDEKTDYVRVPKAVLARIGFDNSKNPWGLELGFKATLDKEHGQVSPTVLGALGLSAKEQSRVQELLSRHLDAYRVWAETNSYLTEFSNIAETWPKLPEGLPTMKINDDTRVWVTPPVSTDEGAWRAQFQQELADVTGSERAEIILRMAIDDNSLNKTLHQFGAKESYLLVTPNPEGGFWLSRNAAGQCLFNSPISFSEVLEPKALKPFDEAGVRQKLSEAIKQRQAEFPDENIPPLEKLVEASRKDWFEEQEIFVVHTILKRPLPQPLVEYLRQWRAAHPEVPNAHPAKSNNP